MSSSLRLGRVPRRRSLREALAWRYRRERERLRQIVLLHLVGCTPSLPYLTDGLVNRSLARLAHPGHRRPGLALGQQLRQQGFVRLGDRLDPEVVAALRREFEAGLTDHAAVKDFAREGADGQRYLARRALAGPWQRLPSLSRLLDGPLRAELADYFCSDFYVSMVEAYRTYGLPAEAKGAFGKFMTWHVDTQQQIDVIKLFVPLDRIDPDQGPTEVLDKPASLTLARRLARRLQHVPDAELERAINGLGGARAMTAEPGEAYLVETHHCFHRAGVPAAGRTRDLLVVRLRPWSRFVAPGALAKGRVGLLKPGPAT